MHALRLHKGRGPGRDKAREIRKLQQVTRQREARGTLLQGLRSFLSADSFMYGPLMESPPIVTTLSDDSEPHTPGNTTFVLVTFSSLICALVHITSTAHMSRLSLFSCVLVATFWFLRSNGCPWWQDCWTDREQENGGVDDDSSRDYVNGEENDTNSGKDIDNGHDESLLRRKGGSRSNSKTVVAVQHTSAHLTARTVLPPADGSGTPSSTAQVPKPSRNGT